MCQPTETTTAYQGIETWIIEGPNAGPASIALAKLAGEQAGLALDVTHYDARDGEPQRSQVDFDAWPNGLGFGDWYDGWMAEHQIGEAL